MHTVKLHRLLAGLAVGTGLFLSGALALADKDQEHASGKSGRVPLPTVNVTQGEQCVEPTDDMRRNHMKYIMHQRDKTMHQGIRTTQHSLKNCVDCHADPKTNSVIGQDGFCSSCHQYAAVTIDCFSCHTDKRTDAAAGNSDPAAARALNAAAARSAGTAAAGGNHP